MAATQGVLSTNLANAVNNDLDFTSRFPGASSASIKVQYIDPGVETATESVAVTYDPATGITLIAVTLRSVSATLSTAAQVSTAVAANGDANKIVKVTNKAGNDGTGLVAAMAATALSAGSGDASIGYTDEDMANDDGWYTGSYVKLGPFGEAVGTFYYAECLVEGQAVRVEAASANASFLAAWNWKNRYLEGGIGGIDRSAAVFAGASTVD
jgi:hypothetical protein